MGSKGRKASAGGGFGGITVSPTLVNPQSQQGQQNIADQTPNAQNTPVNQSGVDAISKMSDSELAALIQQAKTASLPNHLSDVNDLTQQFVFVSGLNAKPMVLDDTQFNQFLSDNNIPKSDILSRSMDDVQYRNNSNTNIKLNADQLFDMLKYSRLNYIGGKRGGQMYGAGTYLARTGGNQRTGYGQRTNDAVLNPQYAKPISRSALRSKVVTFMSTHPQTANLLGPYSSRNASVYAVAMGYNVITDGNTGHGGYVNVIDRRALVWKSKSY